MEFTPLNLPSFAYRLKKTENNKLYIFDIIRKKYVTLTPEEWVRQHFIHYLINTRHYPASLISVEMSFKLNKLDKRSDISIFNNKGSLLMLVECKAPSIELNQKVFDQIFSYNLPLKASYLVVTNGITHIACKLNTKINQIDHFLNEIPDYSTISNMQD